MENSGANFSLICVFKVDYSLWSSSELMELEDNDKTLLTMYTQADSARMDMRIQKVVVSNFHGRSSRFATKEMT